MVLNYHGLYVRQEQVVQRIFGGEVNAPAGPAQILAALGGWAPDVRGRYSAIHALPYTFSAGQIAQDLAQCWPSLPACRTPRGDGHAVVLTAIQYALDPYNNPLLQAVVLRDPWPDNPSRQILSLEEFSGRLTFLAHIYVSQL